MKHVPEHVQNLTSAVFKRYYVNQGVRCWLIIPSKMPSKALQGYLDSIPDADHDNYTCNRQTPWWNFRPHNPPKIVYGSGFVNFSPKMMKNSIRAIAVGSIHGIHCPPSKTKKIHATLTEIDFQKQIVSHSGKLKKIEVGQMNTTLNRIMESTHE